MKRLGFVLVLLAGCSKTPSEIADVDAGSTDGGPVFDELVPPLGAPNLFAIWGETSKNLFAVGEHTTIVQWDGSKWTSMYGTSTTTASLLSIWGSGPEDVYAVGEGGLVLHYSRPMGQPLAWRTENSGVTADLHAISGSDATHLFAVGAGGTIIARTMGGVWQTRTSGTQETLNGLWVGSGGSNAVAVGNLGLILELSSNVWNRVRVTGLTSALQQVRGSRRSELYIVGLGGTLLAAQGSNWRALANTPQVYLRDVWPESGRNAWIVGWDGAVLRTDGTLVTTYFDFTDHRLEGVWGTFEASEELDDAGQPITKPVFFIVGVGGTFLRGPSN